MPFLPPRFDLEPLPNHLKPDGRHIFEIGDNKWYFDTTLPVGSSRKEMFAGPVHPGWRTIRKVNGGEVLLNLKTGKMETIIPLPAAPPPPAPPYEFKEGDLLLFVDSSSPAGGFALPIKIGETYRAAEWNGAYIGVKTLSEGGGHLGWYTPKRFKLHPPTPRPPVVRCAGWIEWDPTRYEQGMLLPPAKEVKFRCGEVVSAAIIGTWGTSINTAYEVVAWR